MSGRVVAIGIAPKAGAPLVTVDSATLAAGHGILGDRYHNETGTFSHKPKNRGDREVTLIEIEEIERFNTSQGSDFAPGSFRRNIVTKGVGLNELVGVRFSVGDALLEGVRLCEPCSRLAKRIGPEVVRAMVHRGGLRARIISGAVIHAGDPVKLVG